MATWQRKQLTLVALLPLGALLYACGSATPNLEASGRSSTASSTGSSSAAVPCQTEAAANGDLCTMPPADSHSHSTPGMAHSDHTMDLGPADATYDLRFIDAMILHHKGAVAMAEAALQQSQRSEIRQLAEAIIAAQAVEIEQMQRWRQAWYPNARPEPVMFHAAMNHDMAMSEEIAAAMRMDLDLGQADDQFDLRFINAMVPHHEGALAMAKEAQAKSTRPEMQALAEAILTSQQGEIDQMNQWRKAWYGQ